MMQERVMSGRAVVVGLAALALVAVPPAHVPSLRGEDDTVVDAATQRAREQPQQHQVLLDQQMNAMFFQNAGTAEQSRQQRLARLMLEVETLESCVGLTPRQRAKCETAAKLDMERVMDEIETVRRRYTGRTIDLQNQAGQAELQRFRQDAQGVQMKLQDLAGETSLLRRVIAGVLDDEQRAAWQRESDLRAEYQGRCVVDSGMAQLDVALGLTTQQHEAIRGLLLEKPLRINPRKLWSYWHISSLIFCDGLARLDQARLKGLVNERQWKTLGQFIDQIDQNPGMVQHLKEQQVILE
jgi:hypothetical protein